MHAEIEQKVTSVIQGDIEGVFSFNNSSVGSYAVIETTEGVSLDRWLCVLNFHLVCRFQLMRIKFNQFCHQCTGNDDN